MFRVSARGVWCNEQKCKPWRITRVAYTPRQGCSVLATVWAETTVVLAAGQV